MKRIMYFAELLYNFSRIQGPRDINIFGGKNNFKGTLGATSTRFNNDLSITLKHGEVELLF